MLALHYDKLHCEPRVLTPLLELQLSPSGMTGQSHTPITVALLVQTRTEEDSGKVPKF
jgi:hypothetical protein